MKLGVPAITICSTQFAATARMFSKTLGVPDLPIVTVHNDVGYCSAARLQELASEIAGAVPDILRKLQSVSDRAPKAEDDKQPESFDFEETPDLWACVTDLFLEKNWTDGLPIVPPTEDRVEAMLNAATLAPDEALGVLRPRGGIASVRKVAVCAVMAGCLPKHFPIVAAAVRGIADPQFALQSIQSTSHPLSPFIVVNGPAGIEAGISNGHDLTPNGWRANICIARAVRLVTINMAGLKDVIASHTQGYLGRFVDCIRENEEESPWEPYHTALGYSRETSTVTVFPAEAPHLVDDRGSNTPQSMLTTFAKVMATGGNRSVFGDCEQTLLFAPLHANYVASQGFSKEDVRDFLYQIARIPLSEFPQGNLDSLSPWHKKLFSNVSDHVTVPVVREKTNIKIIVHGGIACHSMYVPGALVGHSVTVPLVSKE